MKQEHPVEARFRRDAEARVRREKRAQTVADFLVRSGIVGLKVDGFVVTAPGMPTIEVR